MPASEPPIPGISGQTIIDAIAGGRARRGHDVPRPRWPRRIWRWAISCVRAISLVTLGAGNVHEVGTRAGGRPAHARGNGRRRWGEDVGGAVLRLYEPMSRHTTMLIGGPADFWIEPRTVAGFQRLVRHLRDQGIPIRLVGRGSNLLVRDGGIRGAVIHPGQG